MSERCTTVRSHLFALSLTLLSVAQALPVQAEQALPTAREVIDRFVEVTGAKKALTEHSSMTTTGAFSMPAQGMSGKMTIQAKAPNLFLLTITIEGFGEMQQGYDGEVGWSMDPMSGPQLAEAEVLAQMKDQSNFHAMLYRDEDVQSMELTGTQEFNGKQAYRVVVVSGNGTESTLYFDVESGLLIGNEAVQHTAMGSIPTSTVIAEYGDFDGVKMPIRTEQSMMGLQQVLTIDAVSFEDIDEAVFALPAAVAGLVE
jgi:zinc protease